MKLVIQIGMFLVTALVVGDGHAEKQGDPTRGAVSWANNCARCHNMRDPTEFDAKLWVPITWHMRIRAGLTGQETRDIVAFLQQASTPAVPVVSGRAATSPLTGDQVYDSTCIACHAQDGTGAFPGVPDFTDSMGPLATKPSSELLRNMASGLQSPGSPMAMPAMGGNPSLTEDDLGRVLAYLKERFVK